MTFGDSPSGLTPVFAGRVLLASVVWSTVVLMTWTIAIFVLGGGPAAVNLMVIGIGVFWGPVLGVIAGGVHILASFLLGKVIPRLPRDLLAALLGWGAALALWGLLTFSGSNAATTLGSMVVAAIGAGLNFAVARRRIGIRQP